jgi:predicted alpha/beta hydrolase family esterase
MKRAVILHGTDASPESNWFKWLKEELEKAGYLVWLPSLPGNHAPNAKVYNDFLFGSGWDFTDNLIVGHSSGAVSVLNLLSDSRCPKIKAAVMVGAWSTCEGTDLPPEQFTNLFPSEGFDFDHIRSKSSNILFLHGSDDPFCPLQQAKNLAKNLDSEIIVVPGGHHLGQKFKELPILVQSLADKGWL